MHCVVNICEYKVNVQRHDINNKYTKSITYRFLPTYKRCWLESDLIAPHCTKVTLY